MTVGNKKQYIADVRVMNYLLQEIPNAIYNSVDVCKANVQCYICNEKGHYARECQKPKVHDAKYFREQMLLAMKNEAGSNLTNEENDFMLNTDDNTENVPSYDAKAVSENPDCLKKDIATQPKFYNGDSLHGANLIINSHDLEETLENAKESRLKMRNKMVQINYSKLNALYETFVPHLELSAEQTYFLIHSTSNNGSESKEVTS
nr:hypothetical protein [Tanacetum cinerariifolium]